MEHSATFTANAVHEDHGTKEIWRTFWILLGLTIVELILGYIMIGVEGLGMRAMIKGFIIILMMAKAFYIVAYFMHLKSEIKNLIMTILVPLALLLWAIAAFLYEGNSYKNNRNTYDAYHREKGKSQPMEKKIEPEKRRTGEME